MFDNSGDLLELIENSNKYSWKWVQHLDKGLAVSGKSKYIKLYFCSCLI